MSPSDYIDRRRRIFRRRAAYGEEHEVVAQAVEVLGLDATDPEVDHRLVDLYRALRISASTNGMVYLSKKHQHFLAQAIYLLERNTDAITFTKVYVGAVVDRLRLMRCGLRDGHRVRDCGQRVDPS